MEFGQFSCVMIVGKSKIQATRQLRMPQSTVHTFCELIHDLKFTNTSFCNIQPPKTKTLAANFPVVLFQNLKITDEVFKAEIVFREKSICPGMLTERTLECVEKTILISD
jgi:hypothetical protein